MRRNIVFFLLFALKCSIVAQKQAAKWYFADKLGMDFLTSPPTLLANGAMVTNEGSSTISDANGNLVLYTDGDTVWNKFHQPVLNGAGLASGIHCLQHIIVQRPGSADVFYVFTTDEPQSAPHNGFNYSIVNSSLAGGTGSIVIKNKQLISECTEQVAAVRHCNGQDVWIITCSFNDGAFMSYLLTAAGLNTVALKSVVSPTVQWGTWLKVSPTGQRLAMGDPYGASFVLYDFDNATGIVSNQRKLAVGNGTFAMTTGCEFSPDGSKLYGVGDTYLYQWDLCEVSDSAIRASKDSMQLNHYSLLQVAIDGKIYCNPTTSVTAMDVIGNPNAPLPACGYSVQGLYVGKYMAFSMPYFVSSYFRAPLPLFADSISCGTASFSSPPPLCSAQSRSVTGRQWFFGDPASGSANTSSLADPVHVYSAPGDYTVALVLHYGCGSDTIRKVVSVSDVPLMSVTGHDTICKGESASITAGGALTYSWNGTAGTSSVALSPSASAVFTVSGTGANGCIGSRVFSISVDPCIGMDEIVAGFSISVFPNPSNGSFTIHAPQGSVITVRDLLGAQLLKRYQAGDSQVIELPDYANGVYLLEVRCGLGSRMIRLHKNGSD